MVASSAAQSMANNQLTFEPNPTENNSAAPNPINTESRVYTIDARHCNVTKGNLKVNVYYKFLKVVGYLFTTDEIELIEFDEEDNPIREGPLVPKNEAELLKYCKDAHVSKNGSLHYIFKIRIHNSPFFRIKRRLMTWLKKMAFTCSQHT